MPLFHVYLYPVMVVEIAPVEAPDVKQAIQRAIAQAKHGQLDPQGDCARAPLFAEEFARYVVYPLVAGQPNYGNSAIYLDAAHYQADRTDRDDGIPLFDADA